MRVTGHHRSAALAERKRKQLERKYRVPVQLVDRRNDRGRKSRRGHRFTFEFEKVKRKKKGEKRGEYIVTWETTSAGKTRKLDFVVNAHSKARAKQLAFREAKNEKPWTKGIAWTIKVAGEPSKKKERIRKR